MSHPIKTIQYASLQENLTMTFSSYLQRTKLFLKSSEAKIQSFASDSHILRPDDESSLTNMNTLDISMLSQDCEQSVPDSPEMINLKCVVPNVLPQESRPKQFLSSDQKSNVLSSQNVPSSEHSFLRPLFKTLNHDNVQNRPPAQHCCAFLFGLSYMKCSLSCALSLSNKLLDYFLLFLFVIQWCTNSCVFGGWGGGGGDWFNYLLRTVWTSRCTMFSSSIDYYYFMWSRSLLYVMLKCDL